MNNKISQCGSDGDKSSFMAYVQDLTYQSENKDILTINATLDAESSILKASMPPTKPELKNHEDVYQTTSAFTQQEETCNTMAFRLSSPVLGNHTVVLDSVISTQSERPLDRDSSVISNQTVEFNLDSKESCRICHCGNSQESLIMPCKCSGSLQYTHPSCTMAWVKHGMRRQCELCQSDLNVVKVFRPFKKWRRPKETLKPLLWLLACIAVIMVNIASIVKDATGQCFSPLCAIFYSVASIGAVVGTAMLVYWALACRRMWRRWVEMNQDWIIADYVTNDKIQSGLS